MDLSKVMFYGFYHGKSPFVSPPCGGLYDYFFQPPNKQVQVGGRNPVFRRLDLLVYERLVKIRLSFRWTQASNDGFTLFVDIASVVFF